ncbi:MAG TPA: aspartyl protease family protein [Candidatus Angelobacter sp.]|nr:aspartyl protease family protein [Candidatus Angelobacter sp.]
MKRAIYFLSLIIFTAATSFAADEKVGFRLQRGYLIVVQCSIGDLTGLTGIVDTGVTETVVDMSIVKRLGLATRVDRATFLTRELKVVAVSIPPIALGTKITGPVAGIATDLHSLTFQFGIRPDVLIGMDVLTQANLLIDFKNRELSFISSAIPPMAHLIPLAGASRIPLIEVRFHGKSLRLQLDTGAEGVLLYASAVGQPVWEAREVRVAGGAGALIAKSADSGNIHLADTLIFNPLVLVVEERAPADFDGLLGANVLRAQRVGLDFAHHILTWQ